MAAEDKGKWYLLIISKQGGYTVHSIHAKREVAEQWKACKEHDGQDCSIAELDSDMAAECFDTMRAMKG